MPLPCSKESSAGLHSSSMIWFQMPCYWACSNSRNTGTRNTRIPWNTRNSARKPGTPQNTFQKTRNIPEQLLENPKHLIENQKQARKNLKNTLYKTRNTPSPPPKEKKQPAKIYCHHFPLINETSASCYCLLQF